MTAVRWDSITPVNPRYVLLDTWLNRPEAGSQSGVGRVGGRFSMDRLTELKTVVVNLA